MIRAEYIDHMGSDLRVVNAARVSFHKSSEWDTDARMGDENTHGVTGTYCRLHNRDSKLISYLAQHDHFTPFTHCMITLRETVPIFVARQRFKHVVGFTYNEVSRRYVDDDPEFYTPEVWRKRADNVKQGSSDEGVSDVHHAAYTVQEAYRSVVSHSQSTYRDLVASGVAPEQARMVLPQSMLTSYYVTGSLAAFARAYKLRTHPTAQREIQDLARQWDAIIRPLFPVSWAALTSDAS